MNEAIKPIQVFVSHTQKDADFCDKFDIACARVGVKAFRSELESISAPPYKTIKNAMNNSKALFFLVGKELVKNQTIGDPEWNYTQNWIAYEIGLACQLGIDVWAICDDVMLNFPMPYITNYSTISLNRRNAFDYMKTVLAEYVQGRTFPFPYVDSKGNAYGWICPYENCKMEFNYHVGYSEGDSVICPHCLKKFIFSEDDPWKKKEKDKNKKHITKQSS